MNTKITTLALMLYALAYTLLFGTWAVLVANHVAGADQLIGYIQNTLAGLTGHVLTMINSARSNSPPPPGNPQAGFANPFLLLVVAVAGALLMSGCSLLPSNVTKIEEGAAQTVVQSSERTICRDIPIGTWMRLYGTSADRVKGWQALCFNPVSAPLNDATVAAILKVYPGFQQAVETGTPLPAATLPPNTGASVQK